MNAAAAPSRPGNRKVPVFADMYITTVLRRRPLWRRSTAEDYLMLERDGALQRLIESGSIPWAFNIGLRSSRLSEIRVLAHCVVERVYGPVKSIGPTAKLSFPQVVELIVTNHRPKVRGREVQDILSCSDAHVMQLIAAGQLQQIGKPAAADGPNSSPYVSRTSLIRFLEKGRLA